MSGQKNWTSTVEMVRRTMTRDGRVQTGFYSLEGIRLHERALRAGLTLELTILSETFATDPAKRNQKILANLQSAPSHIIPNPIMNELTQGRGLGDIISLVKIPAQPHLSDLVTAVTRPLMLVAVEIVDPGNVGAMVRTAHANDVAAFVTVGVSDPFHPKAVRTSMGSLFKTAVCHYQNIEPLLTDLKQLGIQTVGTASNAAIPLPEMQFSEEGTAVFMGNEYNGLPEEIMVNLDTHVTIPMAEGIDSLSVNAATAVVLYEIRRQRDKRWQPELKLIY